MELVSQKLHAALWVGGAAFAAVRTRMWEVVAADEAVDRCAGSVGGAVGVVLSFMLCVCNGVCVCCFDAHPRSAALGDGLRRPRAEYISTSLSCALV